MARALLLALNVRHIGMPEPAVRALSVKHVVERDPYNKIGQLLLHSKLDFS